MQVGPLTVAEVELLEAVVVLARDVLVGQS